MIDYYCDRLRYYAEELAELNDRAIRTVDVSMAPLPSHLNKLAMVPLTIDVPTTYRLYPVVCVPYTSINLHVAYMPGTVENRLPILQYGSIHDEIWVRYKDGREVQPERPIVLAPLARVRLISLLSDAEEVQEVTEQYIKTAQAYIKEAQRLTCDYTGEEVLPGCQPGDNGVPCRIEREMRNGLFYELRLRPNEMM